MRADRLLLALCILFGGCGGCHPDSGTGTGSSPVGQEAERPDGLPPQITPGRIQAGGLRPPVAGGVGSERGAEQAPGAPVPDSESAGGRPPRPKGPEGDCIVVIDANPDYGPPPLAVAFSAEAECSAGQPMFAWSFGDGAAKSTDVNPSHTYTKAGDYTATVTVTGPDGTTATDEIDITVEDEGGPEDVDPED